MLTSVLLLGGFSEVRSGVPFDNLGFLFIYYVSYEVRDLVVLRLNKQYKHLRFIQVYGTSSLHEPEG